MTADSFAESSARWSPGEPLTVQVDGQRWIIGASTTVWWRRPGPTLMPADAGLEAQLIADECAALFPGTLAAAGVRWVDAPWVMSRARLKAVQLSMAMAVGAHIPSTLIVGDPTSARAFARNHDVIAKAASSGEGIAPYTGLVPAEQLSRVRHCPTLLQYSVHATADLRVITIGQESFVWSRPRCVDEPIDWRSGDPTGSGFTFRQDLECDGAPQVAQKLGLRFSVQDWLATDDGDVFLEVNPQGQWLFLDAAEAVLVPRLASYLSNRG